MRLRGGQNLARPGSRINVVGTCGCGKTTAARDLAAALHVPWIELDALFWKPGWMPSTDEEFRRQVATVAARDGWVIDGNYSRVRDLIWSRADTIVWLDYGFSRTLARLVRRTVRRCVSQEPLWHDNREKFSTAFLSKDSIFLWAIRTHARRRREYSELRRRPEHAHLAFIQLRSPRETETWLGEVARQASALSPPREDDARPASRSPQIS